MAWPCEELQIKMCRMAISLVMQLAAFGLPTGAEVLFKRRKNVSLGIIIYLIHFQPVYSLLFF